MSSQTFGLLEDLAPPPLALWWPEAIGLAAGVFSTAVFLPARPEFALSWIELWRKASGCTVPVFLATMLAAYTASRVTASGARWPALKASASMACAASWFPVVALFFRLNSPWCAAITGALSVIGCRALLFRVAAPVAPRSLMYPASAMAAALEFGSFAAFCENWRAAAMALALATALLAFILNRTRPLTRRRNTTIWLIPAFLMSIPFSAGAMAPYLAPANGPGGPAAFLRRLFGVPQPGGTISARAAAGMPSTMQAGTSVGRSVIIGDVHPAVILWPDVEPFTLLVPPLPSEARGLADPRITYSPGTSFSGFYSFRRATVLPPKDTYVTHGDPAELGFRTTDASPLIMEARQDFGRSIDLKCCRYIAVQTRVAEARPGTVKLVLELHDTMASPPDYQSLGPELLNDMVKFQVRPRALPRQFDRLVVRFILGNPRWDQSAKVAIRRFLFIP